MKKILIAAICTVMIAPSVFAVGTHQVRGYTKKNGTYVSGYTRTNPDGIKSNNRGCLSGKTSCY